jgi:hypothetical protein
MNMDHGAALAKWLRRLRGSSALPFRVDRRGLYRISDLYKGYDSRKPESWAGAFDHAVHARTLGTHTSMFTRNPDPCVTSIEVRFASHHEAQT